MEFIIKKKQKEKFLLEQPNGETDTDLEKCIFFPMTFSLSPAGAMLKYSLK